MQVVLAMFRADGDRRSFSLHKDMTVIGRREDCDLRIPLGEISRKHCRLIRDGDTLRVEDLGSSNGTYVNGQRVQEATVAAGDTIQVGSLAFVVQIDGMPADEELQPVRSNAVANSQGSGGPLEDSGADVAMAPAAAEPADGDDFDPMAILDGADSAPGLIPDPEDSGAMILPEDSAAPAASDDSGADDVAPLDIDLEEPKHS
jgi:predicted component of type VI protein secretion system